MRCKAWLVVILGRLPWRVSRPLASVIRRVWPGFGAA